MRLLDRLRNADRRGGELSELQTLADRLNRACEGAPEAKRRLCESRGDARARPVHSTRITNRRS